MNKLLFIFVLGFPVYMTVSHTNIMKSVEEVKCLEEDIKAAQFFKKERHWKTVSPSTFAEYSTLEEFAKYLYKTSVIYEQTFHIPREIILAKAWHETSGGRKGVGRRGSMFGIKGKGNRGFDKVDAKVGRGEVEYQSYKARWESISHFCKLITQKNPMYRERYVAWLESNSSLEYYEAWAYAMQVHPNKQKSRSAYAMCGCSDGTKDKCWKTRKKSAETVIALAEKIRAIPGFLEDPVYP